MEVWRRRVPEQPGPLSPRAEAAVAALEQVLARVVEDPQVGRRPPRDSAACEQRLPCCGQRGGLHP